MTYSTLRDVLGVLRDARLIAGNSAVRRKVRGFSSDSRSIRKGEVFVALAGESFDGHDFLKAVAEKGASAAIISKKPRRPIDLPLVLVDDTLAAYGELATAHRASFRIPVLAVAGSNGKTTTKEMIGDVLKSKYRVLMTEANLNNLIGTPATLLNLSKDHDVAVIEIGTNAPGEISRLAHIVQPTHGVITNIGREHLELLKDLDGVAKEEGELFEYLAAHGGVALINADDPYLDAWRKTVIRHVSYGSKGSLDVRGRVKLDAEGYAQMQITDARSTEPKTVELKLRTPGLHSATNALAAMAAGLALKVPMSKIAKALKTFEPRSYHHGYARLAPMRASVGALVLNDTYNSNPDSLRAGIRTLASLKPGKRGRRIVVLGDMRELGSSSASEHEGVGHELIASNKVDVAYFFGDEMRRAHEVIRRGGDRPQSFHYTEKQKLIDDLKASLNPSDVLLVKGSRGMTMEDVVKAIV